MPRTKHPPRNSKPSKEIQRPVSPRSKFIFNGARLNRLLLCTLAHEPWLAGYRQVKPTYKAIAAEYNKGLPEKEHIKYKTAQEKVKQLLRIRRDGGQPTKELRAVFESGEDVQFSALLDRVVKEFDDARDRKAAKSAARAKELEEREAAGARVRANGTANLVLTNAARERRAAAASATTDTAATLTTTSPTTPQLSESSAAPTSSSSSPLAPFATGPLHDVLSQFMSIQNRVADQRADRDRQLLHIIAEELKKQNGMIQQILDILTGYGAFSSPPPPSPHASPSSPLSTPSPTTSSSSSQAQSSTADEMDVDKEDIAPDGAHTATKASEVPEQTHIYPLRRSTRHNSSI